jgi:hypothetical protein
MILSKMLTLPGGQTFKPGREADDGKTVFKTATDRHCAAHAAQC